MPDAVTQNPTQFVNTMKPRHVPQRPYPSHLVTSWLSPRGTLITLRPIRRKDAAIEQAFIIALSPESRYFRFKGTLRDLSPLVLLHFTQIDYEHDMAFVAVVKMAGSSTQVGVCRYIANADDKSCEFAVAIADNWQRCGLALRMMQLLIHNARAQGRHEIVGEILVTNAGVLALCKKLGFSILDSEDGPAVKYAVLALSNTRSARGIRVGFDPIIRERP